MDLLNTVKNLNIEELENARVCVLENAQSLYKEAILLEKHGFYARAYSLAHICNEELSKLPMIVGIAMDVVNGEAIDWKNFNKRISSHIKKIDYMHVENYLNSEIRSDDSDLCDFRDSLRSTVLLNNDKNNSLYAGVVDGKFTQPNHLFDQTKVRKLLVKLTERLSYYELVESQTVGKIGQSKSSLNLRKIAKKHLTSKGSRTAQ